MNDPNQNQTDIFGNVTSFQTPVQPVNPQPQMEQNLYQQPQMPNFQEQNNDVVQIIDVPAPEVTVMNQPASSVIETPVVEQPVAQSQMVQSTSDIYPQTGYQIPNQNYVNPVPVEPVPIIDIPQEETTEIPNQSFTEMPFAGVNQQQEEAKRVTILESQPTVMNVDEQVQRSSNMEPVQKQEDENSGLKFLLFLGIIFAVVIILLPYL